MSATVHNLETYGERRMKASARDPKGTQPPHDAALEMALLADMLDQRTGAESFDAVRDLLSPQDFFLPVHRAIFAAVVDLQWLREEGTSQRAIGFPEVAQWLRRNTGQTGSPFVRDLNQDELGALQDVTKASSIFDDIGVAQIAGRVEPRARKLKELSHLRSTIEKLWTAAAIGHANDVDAFKVALADVRRSSESIGAKPKDETEHIAEPFKRVFEKYLGTRSATVELVTTGFPDLDALVLPEPGSLIVIGARSGRGKSSLAMQIAMHISEAHGDVLYFSTEMPSDQLALRAACTAARVDSKRVRRSQCSQEEGQRLVDVYARLGNMAQWMNDRSNLDITDIAGIARRESKRIARDGRKLKLVVIDYLQRIRAGKAAGKDFNREQQVASIAREAKDLALELKCCVLVPAQLNADGDKRDDERPRVSDLRESKTIESEADAVILIHNPSYISRVEDDERDMSEMEACDIILGKGRNDGNGMTRMWFTPMFSRFDSMTDAQKLAQRETVKSKRGRGK